MKHTIKKWVRLVKGWYRLRMKDTCPHCNSDAGRPCPVCRGLTEPNLAVNADAVWVRYKKLNGVTE